MLFNKIFKKSKAKSSKKTDNFVTVDQTINFFDTVNNSFSLTKVKEDNLIFLEIINNTNDSKLIIDKEKALLLSMFLNEYGLTGNIVKSLDLLEKGED